MTGCIPSGDVAFSAWLDNFVTYTNADWPTWGSAARDLTPVATAQETWNTACTANLTARQAAKSAAHQKNTDRAGPQTLVGKAGCTTLGCPTSRGGWEAYNCGAVAGGSYIVVVGNSSLRPPVRSWMIRLMMKKMPKRAKSKKGSMTLISSMCRTHARLLLRCRWLVCRIPGGRKDFASPAFR